MPRLYSHFPDMSSSTVGAHVGQRIRFGGFRHYDYGPTKNVEVYGQSIAPPYNLSSIQCKYIVLMSAQNDFLSDETDDDILRSQLRGNPNYINIFCDRISVSVPLYTDYLVPYQFFSHGDFLYGNNAGVYINSPILRILASLNLNSEIANLTN